MIENREKFEGFLRQSCSSEEGPLGGRGVALLDGLSICIIVQQKEEIRRKVGSGICRDEGRKHTRRSGVSAALSVSQSSGARPPSMMAYCWQTTSSKTKTPACEKTRGSERGVVAKGSQRERGRENSIKAAVPARQSVAGTHALRAEEGQLLVEVGLDVRHGVHAGRHGEGHGGQRCSRPDVRLLATCQSVTLLPPLTRIRTAVRHPRVAPCRASRPWWRSPVARAASTGMRRSASWRQEKCRTT